MQLIIRVGIGTSSPSGTIDAVVDSTGGLKLTTNADAGVTLTAYQGSTNANVRTLDFDVQNFVVNTGSPTGTSTTERMRIDSAGNVGIGNSSPLGKLTISNAAGANAPSTVTAANTYLQLGSDDYGPSNNGKFMIGFGFTDATNTNSPAYIGYEEASTSGDTYGDLTFYTRSVTTDTAPTERMRIDSSGNFIVGATSAFSSSSFCVDQSGLGQFRRDGTPLLVRRDGSQGALISFEDDGASVGSITTWNGELAIGRLNCALLFDDDTNRIKPHSVQSNIVRDNDLDLGGPSARFDDIYATNGTIQTSDRNEKQDIEALSDAEQRVAVAAKGLLRKFRWIKTAYKKTVMMLVFTLESLHKTYKTHSPLKA